MMNFPDYVAARPKGARREVAVKLDYSNVVVVGKGTVLHPFHGGPVEMEALLVGGVDAKGRTRLFPCRRKGPNYAIGHCDNYMSLPAEFSPDFEVSELDSIRPK